MKSERNGFTIIITALLGAGFLLVVGLSAGAGIHASTEANRIHACESLPSSKREACINPPVPKAPVPAPPAPIPVKIAYVNACNSAAANWNNQDFNNNPVFPWQQCMEDLVGGTSVPTRPAKN